MICRSLEPLVQLPVIADRAPNKGVSDRFGDDPVPR